MTTNADIGLGIKLQKGDGATPTEAFADISVEVTMVDPPGFQRDSIDATHHGSPNGYRESIPGLAQIDEIKIAGNLVPAAADEIVGYMADDAGNWRIVFPNNVSWTVRGFFTAYKPSAPLDNKMEFEATLKCSGEITIA